MISMPYIRPDPKIDTVFQPPKIDTRQLTRNDIEKGLRTHRRMLIEKKKMFQLTTTKLNLYFSLQIWLQLQYTLLIIGN